MAKKSIVNDGGIKKPALTIMEGGRELEATPTVFQSDGPGWTHYPVESGLPGQLPKEEFSARSERKIAVCGSAASSVGFAPYDDPSWEIWSCSPANKGAPRVDVWFELHNPEVKVREGLLEWMQWL